MSKWVGFVIEHGIAGVAALLVGLGAVWWIEPTTDAGAGFLLLLAFLVAFAAIELGRKALRSTGAGRSTEETPAEGEAEPAAAPATPAAEKDRRPAG